MILKLQRLFQHKVLKLLLKEKRISQAGIYRCKMNPVVKKNFAVFPLSR